MLVELVSATTNTGGTFPGSARPLVPIHEGRPLLSVLGVAIQSLHCVQEGLAVETSHNENTALDDGSANVRSAQEKY